MEFQKYDVNEKKKEKKERKNEQRKTNSCTVLEQLWGDTPQIKSDQISRSVVSDSVRPHRWQPTRLPQPWDSPGKNTGVGCHFLLQCMKVKSESKVVQSCLTHSDPMDCSPPGSSIHGIFQARVLEWGAIAFSVLLFSHWQFSWQMTICN